MLFLLFSFDLQCTLCHCLFSPLLKILGTVGFLCLCLFACEKSVHVAIFLPASPKYLPAFLTTTFTHTSCLFSFLSPYFHTYSAGSAISSSAFFHFLRPPSLSLSFAFVPFYAFLIFQLCFVSCTRQHTALLLRFFPHTDF